MDRNGGDLKTSLGSEDEFFVVIEACDEAP